MCGWHLFCHSLQGNVHETTEKGREKDYVHGFV